MITREKVLLNNNPPTPTPHPPKNPFFGNLNIKIFAIQSHIFFLIAIKKCSLNKQAFFFCYGVKVRTIKEIQSADFILYKCDTDFKVRDYYIR